MWRLLQDYLQFSRTTRSFIKVKHLERVKRVRDVVGAEFIFTARRDVRFFFDPTSLCIKKPDASILELCPDFTIFSPSGLQIEDSEVSSNRDFLARLACPLVGGGVVGSGLFIYGTVFELNAYVQLLTGRLRVLRFFIYNRRRKRRYILPFWELSVARSFPRIWSLIGQVFGNYYYSLYLFLQLLLIGRK